MVQTIRRLEAKVILNHQTEKRMQQTFGKASYGWGNEAAASIDDVGPKKGIKLVIVGGVAGGASVSVYERSL